MKYTISILILAQTFLNLILTQIKFQTSNSNKNLILTFHKTNEPPPKSKTELLCHSLYFPRLTEHHEVLIHNNF